MILSKINFFFYREVDPNLADEDYASYVNISLESLPTNRFSRNVVRSKLDLVGGYSKKNLSENYCTLKFWRKFTVEIFCEFFIEIFGRFSV